jgi:hypothetical protein
MCFPLISKFGELSNSVINDEARMTRLRRATARQANDERNLNAQMTKAFGVK